MTRQSTSFALADVIAGKLHLYAANPPSARSDASVASPAAAQRAQSNRLRQSFAGGERAFGFGSTPADALAAELDRAIDR